MREFYYQKEVEAVWRAINTLRSENDPSLISELQAEHLAAGTSLEWYGITKSVFYSSFTSATDFCARFPDRQDNR